MGFPLVFVRTAHSSMAGVRMILVRNEVQASLM